MVSAEGLNHFLAFGRETRGGYSRQEESIGRTVATAVVVVLIVMAGGMFLWFLIKLVLPSMSRSA